MILVPEEEYLQLTGIQNEDEKPTENSAKMDEITEKFTKMELPRESQQK